jgi:hypothetical protein
MTNTTDHEPLPELPSVATKSNSAKASGRWAIWVSALTMLTTLLPYLLAMAQSDGRRFMWLGYNLDDSCVYLSWMRQAADGSFRALNLFTTDPQNGLLLNPLFLVLGKFAGITGLPLLAVYHAARLLFGFLLLLAVWKFICQTISAIKTRRTAFLFVCISSGLGWLPFWWNDFAPQTSIDKWQPEAITFLSLYLSPLFCFSLLLQVIVISQLYAAHQTGQIKHAVVAGAAGFVLGLTHTYDVVSLSLVWLTYIIIQTIKPTNSEHRARLWIHAAIAGIITLPSVAYIALELRSEAVFRARANVETLSPSLAYVVLGYGIPFCLAVYALIRGIRPHNRTDPPPNTELSDSPPPAAYPLLACWLVMNIVAAYLPVPWQRKMLQGTHFPVAILAGVGWEWLMNARPQWQNKRHPVLAVTLGLAALTNVRFVLREIENFGINRAVTMFHRPYLKPGELDALEWIRTNSNPNDAIQPLPWVSLTAGVTRQTVISDVSIACFTPGLIHRKVYCGHWGETPDYLGKLITLRDFALPRTAPEQRLALLRAMNVRYLLFSQKETTDGNADQTMPMFRGRSELPTYLRKVYSNPDADVYEVIL